MAPAGKREGREREESCFSRAARSIRRALARICGGRDSSPPPNLRTSRQSRYLDSHYEFLSRRGSSFVDYESQAPRHGDTFSALNCRSDRDTYQCLTVRQPIKKGHFHTDPDHCYSSLSYGRETGRPPRPSDQHPSLLRESLKRKSSGMIPRRQKMNKTDDPHGITSRTDSSDSVLGPPPPGSLRQTGIIKNPAASTPGVNQDITREMELHTTAGPSTRQCSSSNYDGDSESDTCYQRERDRDEPSRSLWSGCRDQETHKYKHASFLCPPLSDPNLHLPIREDTDDGGPSFTNSSSAVSIPTCSQSTAPDVDGPPCPQVRPAVHSQYATRCTEGSRPQDACQLSSVQSDSEPIGDRDAPMEMEAPVTAVNCSVTNTLPAPTLLQISSSDPGWSRRDSSRLPRSASMPSLSQITSGENKTFTRAESVPDMLLKTSFEEFTPDITADETDESYRFQCSGPGLYQCSVTGLVFHMEGEGDVVYRVVPWNRRLLAQHHKKPAGPLFDIKCLQQSVCQLHLPHCEIPFTGGRDFLSVAHVMDEGVEFIGPHRITDTHVIINITRFSGFGNVKDEDSPPAPVRALVLLFYRPPADPDPESLLNVLLLPRNVVLGMSCASEEQEYTLSTRPEDDSVLVQPTEAEFDSDNYDNFFPSFQVSLETIMKHMKLILRDSSSSHSVWERRVCLSSSGVRRSCGPSAGSLRPDDRLLDIRSSFIDGYQDLFSRVCWTNCWRKRCWLILRGRQRTQRKKPRDKARFVVDTVRKKGEAASSEMIEFLREADPFLCEHLGLI
ncbi:uncharacterized protein LOC116674953 [Etheostoma spectabile]|uniref:uncharacterized protein LOC116674953 n=1 Tax=Etheostoma spectabile TaxID=54343 RepID=UPI0013AF8213|nr:uncharacterized protein LOC116674953 [Etheostoma spectabile]